MDGFRESGDDELGERLAYRPAELAGLVGLSCKAIYRAIERGELRAGKVANGWRSLIPVGEAEAWLAKSLVAPRERSAVETPPRRRVGHPRGLADAIAELDLSQGPESGIEGRHGEGVEPTRLGLKAQTVWPARRAAVASANRAWEDIS